jgi:hypothetical protein
MEFLKKEGNLLRFLRVRSVKTAFAVSLSNRNHLATTGLRQAQAERFIAIVLMERTAGFRSIMERVAPKSKHRKEGARKKIFRMLLEPISVVGDYRVVQMRGRGPRSVLSHMSGPMTAKRAQRDCEADAPPCDRLLLQMFGRKPHQGLG